MNLIYKHGQEHRFKIISYPDGQQSVELDMDYFHCVKKPISIFCSIRNFKELEILLCLISSLRKNDFLIEKLTFNYLFGMRSDRAFSIGQPNYFRDVLAPIINNLNIPMVDIKHPHSVLSAFSINKIICGSFDNHLMFMNDYFVIGADDSTFNKFICATNFHKIRKENDIELFLNKESINYINNSDRQLLVVDDLCDGGLTFIRASECLKEHFPDRKINLFVAHGLFTKGVDHVSKHYNKIITTNSYQELEPHIKLIIIDVWSY